MKAINFKRSKKSLIWLRNAYWHKTQRVVIYGVTGVGKTEFLHTVLGRDFSDEQRTQDLIEYDFRLPDGHKIVFIDSPGHPSMRDLRDRLLEDYSQHKIQGIINVVCHGYHSTPDTPLDDVFQAGTVHVKEEYLRENRKTELNQIYEWERFVRAHTQVKWFMTIVNKADIWYDNFEEVDNYYRDTNGDYYNAVQGIGRCCETHTYHFCSIMKPFMQRFRSAQYSEVNKKRMYQELIAQLQRLASK